MNKPQSEAGPFEALTAQGLNLCAVFTLDALPPDVLATLDVTDAERQRFRQLILIGHQGRDFWNALQQRGMHGAHPVDQFVTECVAQWMQVTMQAPAWRQVFPGPGMVGLQRLGGLAGWHQPSPFWVGVDAEWGSWFAYRAVVLADTALPPTPRRECPPPCATCVARPCVNACPAGALADTMTGAQRLSACLDFRRQSASPCQDRCLARNACPVGAEHRYSDQQISYHYLHSMRAIREHC